MKLISYNVNGLRSATKKGFLDYLESNDYDIIALQEIRLNQGIPYNEFLPFNYLEYSNLATKKGYSGVMFLVKEEPINIIKNLGHERFDNEGRMIILEYEEHYLINFYIPHGDHDKHNLEYKLEVYQHIFKLLESLKKPIIMLGDFNIAHTINDVERAKDNLKNIMFTEEERKQISKILELGFIDSFRYFNKEKGFYSWYPYNEYLRANNVGWRIDYIFVSNSLDKYLKKADILAHLRYSDHVSVILEIF